MTKCEKHSLPRPTVVPQTRGRERFSEMRMVQRKSNWSLKSPTKTSQRRNTNWCSFWFLFLLILGVIRTSSSCKADQNPKLIINDPPCTDDGLSTVEAAETDRADVGTAITEDDDFSRKVTFLGIRIPRKENEELANGLVTVPLNSEERSCNQTVLDEMIREHEDVMKRKVQIFNKLIEDLGLLQTQYQDYQCEPCLMTCEDNLVPD